MGAHVADTSELSPSSLPVWLIWAWLIYFTEKAMAPHSSVLACRIPGTEEPGGLLSLGSHRVERDWSDLAAAAAQSFPGGASRKEPACQRDVELQVWSLGWEDPLEEGMTTHFSILPWRIPWSKEPDRLQSMGLQRVGHDWSNLALTHIVYIPCLGE